MGAVKVLWEILCLSTSVFEPSGLVLSAGFHERERDASDLSCQGDKCLGAGEAAGDAGLIEGFPGR